MAIKIAILGYGNLGRGIESAIMQNSDLELTAIFSRRDPSTVKVSSSVPVYHVDDILKYKDSIDVLILCGGSATDLPVQTPEYAKYFNVIDSFDTHARIPEHFAKNPSITVKDGVCSVLTSWGETSEAPVPVKAGNYTAVLIDYRDGSVNLLTLSEESAKAYIVVDENGNDIGRLTDIVK